MCSPKERKTDLIKKCFTPNCGVLERIWQGNNLLNPCATIVFTASSVCTDGIAVILFIKKNGSLAFFLLNQGESRAITIDQIDSIWIGCFLGTIPGLCEIDLSMIIHYDCC